MPLASRVETAILNRDGLFLLIDADAVKAGLSVSHGGQHLPLERLSALPAELGGLFNRKPFDLPQTGSTLVETLLDGTAADTTTEIMVDKLPDWALENGKTLQLRVDDFQQPRVIATGATVTVSPSTEARVFSALVAMHRADAEVIIRFDPAPLGMPQTQAIPLDPKFTGGRRKNGYQEISIPCPASDQAMTAHLMIRYLGYRDDGQGNYPYIFIANPELTGTKARKALLVPRTRSIGTPPKPFWHKATVPSFRRPGEAAITLHLGAEELDLFAPEENGVTLIDDYGHTLMLKAERTGDFLLCVDGQPLDRIHLRDAETAIRLPAACLRGEIVNVSIRDLSGSQIFLSLPVLAPRALTPQDVIARETRAPFPTDLTVRANHRYKGLRAHLDHPVPGLDLASLATAAQTLDCSFETVKLRPIAFPQTDKPSVSVIIPAHNKVEVIYYCLSALLVAHNRTSFEVILVDDASTDETTTIEQIVTGIRVIRNAEPQRFIRACNAGVAAARGDHVVLLNNDTEPTVGWLDALLDAFDRLDNVGLAGAKLLYPDGKLQEAGGIVWGSGNPWNYGNRANPWEPRFSYARQADYLSGAALMTTRRIWDEVSGLSSYLEPMYFEDTDLAFKIRDAGYKTWFVPASVVYHFEGVTSGTDTTQGFKKHQELNRPKFKRQWARAYASHGKEGQSPDLEKDRGIAGRVLFIDYTTPRPDRDAGSYAALREIELVQSLGYKVTFLPQNLAHMGGYTDDLQNIGVEVVTAPFYTSLAEFLTQRAAEFDAFYITRYYVAQDTIRHIRAHAPRARILLNNADLHFLRELRAALSTDDPSRLAAMRRVRDEELEMMRAADLVLSYNEVEHAIIASHTDGAVPVMTCPWVVDIPAAVPPLADRTGLSFLGSFKHHPNAEGVTWFCRSVLPLVPEAHLTIYGAGMDDRVRALASGSIDPVGFVADMATAYDRHRVFVAPLLSGAGIKGKVLSALAHGIPTVLTPVAAEGIGLRHGHDCLIAESHEDWATAIARLLAEDALWTQISTAARSYAAERFSFAQGREKMKAAFEAVDLFGAG